MGDLNIQITQLFLACTIFIVTYPRRVKPKYMPARARTETWRFCGEAKSPKGSQGIGK
jgi:hypothetical protein